MYPVSMFIFFANAVHRNEKRSFEHIIENTLIVSMGRYICSFFNKIYCHFIAFSKVKVFEEWLFYHRKSTGDALINIGEICQNIPVSFCDLYINLSSFIFIFEFRRY
jgi:hypothetical protein